MLMIKVNLKDTYININAKLKLKNQEKTIRISSLTYYCITSVTVLLFHKLEYIVFIESNKFI